MSLEVSGLSVEYGPPRVCALDSVSFSLDSGRSAGIAGESGCGKSTLGHAIMRSLRGGRATAGSISYGGRDLLSMTKKEYDEKIRWTRISMVFQGAMNSLDPVFAVGVQMRQVLQAHGAAQGAAGKISEAAAAVGLPEHALLQYPHELSGGMRQRAAIAMAVLLEPDLIIADEPTTALDVLLQAQIMGLFWKLKKRGTSILFITHDLSILSEIADSLGIMYAGQMAEFGRASDVYGSPRHPYTRGLLSSVPRLGGEPPGYMPGSAPRLDSPPESCRFADRCPEAMEKCSQDPGPIPCGTGYARCWLCKGQDGPRSSA